VCDSERPSRARPDPATYVAMHGPCGPCWGVGGWHARCRPPFRVASVSLRPASVDEAHHMSDSPPATPPMSRSTKAPACPACKRGSGRICGVTVGATQRTPTYVCEDCQHGWTTTEQDPREPFFSLTRTAMMTRPWQTLRSLGEVCGKDRGARRGASGRGQEAKARQYSRRRAANSVLRRRCPCCWAGACSCVS
jgi:hypothetical protein